MVSGAARALQQVLAATKRFIVGNRDVRVSALLGHAGKSRAAADRFEGLDPRLADGIRSPDSRGTDDGPTGEYPLPNRADVPRFETTGLGDEVDRLAALSPTLQRFLGELKQDGWTIGYRDVGGGAHTRRSDARITVHSGDRDDPAKVLGALAHEVGHSYRSAYEPQPVRYDGQGRTRWVRASAFEHLRDEGEAALVETQILREIAAAGGPKLRTSGRFGDRYEDHYDRYLRGELTREDARDENAHCYMKEYRSGSEESGTPETYLAHYEAIYHSDFDNDEAMQGARLIYGE
ncbi:hypothetical protein [Nocardia fusca]|uniref:hypothetical protein n=1 Tax=Nocardia fusca TaxID=941183 RepID=UPI0007A75F30|nr:hypothetical protein [Nocardia fusca]